MEVGFTNHFFEDRNINEKKEKRIKISNSRANKKVFTKEFITFLLKPYYDKLIDKFDKFLFIFNNNNFNNEKTYLLLASENNKLIMISTMVSSSSQIKYKNIKLENIIRVDDKFFDDIFLDFKKEKELKHSVKPTVSKEIKEKIKRGLNKIVVEKPKPNLFKQYFDLINSNEFLTFSKEKQNKILLAKEKLYFYDKYASIEKEEAIEYFLKAINILEKKFILKETNVVNSEYINYLLNEIYEYRIQKNQQGYNLEEKNLIKALYILNS